MTKRVLMSAPYMVRIADQFRNIFEESGIELIVTAVDERLSEDELLEFAGEVDGVLCGDDQFTAEVLEQFAPRLKGLI